MNFVKCSVQSGYAGFWKRGAAFFLDLLIVMFPQAFLGDVFGSAFVSRMASVDPIQEHIGYTIWFQIFGSVVMWVYMAGMESSAFQATIGKLLLGIKVVDQNGERISFAQATGRFFARILSVLPAGAGLLAIAVSGKKQAFHDMMSGCLVVNKEPVDENTQYSRTQDILRSPVIAAIVIAFTIIIAVSMCVRKASTTDIVRKASTTDIAAPVNKIDLGTIRVIHSLEGPVIMQNILTGPNILENGRELFGPIKISDIPLRISGSRPDIFGEIPIKIEGKINGTQTLKSDFSFPVRISNE